MLSTFGGCTSVIEQYEEAQTLATTPPGAAGDAWAPDAAIQLSEPLLDQIITASLHPAPTFDGTIQAGLVSLSPALTVDSLKIGAATTCRECLQLDVNIGGSIGWSTMIGTGQAAAKIGCSLDSALAITPIENGFAIGAVPRAIHDVHLEIAGFNAGVNLDGPISSFVQTTVLAGMPTLTLTEVGTDTAPVRALRITSQQKVLRVDLLSGARMNTAVPLILPPPTDGFSVDVSLVSLLAIAKAEAFKAGPMTYGLLAEPTALDFSGDRFTVGLRLWKTTGRGWWRDYEIVGTWGLEGDQFVMNAERVVDKGHSPGAAFADPLIAMTEGIVQRSIRSALDTTVPASSGQLGALGAEIVLTGLEASNGILRARGTVKLPQ
ncbi:MAG: hypothetical protein ABMA64_11480 [Myxococcota bacterium]